MKHRKLGLSQSSPVNSSVFRLTRDGIRAYDDRPARSAPGGLVDVLAQGIANGKTGVATGEGFYTYDADGRPTGVSDQFPEIWEG